MPIKSPFSKASSICSRTLLLLIATVLLIKSISLTACYGDDIISINKWEACTRSSCTWQRKSGDIQAELAYFGNGSFYISTARKPKTVDQHEASIEKMNHEKAELREKIMVWQYFRLTYDTRSNFNRLQIFRRSHFNDSPRTSGQSFTDRSSMSPAKRRH